MFTHFETGSKVFLDFSVTIPKMARGFESKSVEQQQAEMEDRRKPSGPSLTREQQEQNRKREGLLLSRTRLSRELQATTNPQRRQMLTSAIEELDLQLASLQRVEI